MTWPKFGKTEAGKSEEDQSKAEADALIERLGATIDERLKPLREDVTAMKSRWEDIEREATKALPETNADGTPKLPTEEEKAKNAAQATVALAVTTNARLTESEVLSELPKDWSHLIPEIRKYFTDTPIQRKAQADYADYCRNCADLVIAKAARSAGLRFNQENKSFFLEDKSTTQTREEGPLSEPGLEWDQVKPDGSHKRWSVADQCRSLGIDPKELAENMKRGVV